MKSIRSGFQVFFVGIIIQLDEKLHFPSRDVQFGNLKQIRVRYIQQQDLIKKSNWRFQDLKLGLSATQLGFNFTN